MLRFQRAQEHHVNVRRGLAAQPEPLVAVQARQLEDPAEAAQILDGALRCGDVAERAVRQRVERNPRDPVRIGMPRQRAVDVAAGLPLGLPRALPTGLRVGLHLGLRSARRRVQALLCGLDRVARFLPAIAPAILPRVRRHHEAERDRVCDDPAPDDRVEGVASGARSTRSGCGGCHPPPSRVTNNRSLARDRTTRPARDPARAGVVMRPSSRASPSSAASRPAGAGAARGAARPRRRPPCARSPASLRARRSRVSRASSCSIRVRRARARLSLRAPRAFISPRSRPG